MELITTCILFMKEFKFLVVLDSLFEKTLLLSPYLVLLFIIKLQFFPPTNTNLMVKNELWKIFLNNSFLKIDFCFSLKIVYQDIQFLANSVCWILRSKWFLCKWLIHNRMCWKKQNLRTDKSSGKRLKFSFSYVW